MSMTKLAYSPALFLLLLATLMLVQFWLSRSAKNLYGLILPAAYWLFSGKAMYRALHYVTPRMIPDYYLFGMLFSVGVLFLLSYFIGYYYWKWKKEINR